MANINHAQTSHDHQLIFMEERRRRRVEQWAAEEHREFVYDFKEELQSVLDFYRASIVGEVSIDGEMIHIDMKGVQE